MTDLQQTEVYVAYDNSVKKPRLTLLEKMYVERGDKHDWELLKELHYRGHNLPVWPRYFRLGMHIDKDRTETIGVIVINAPKPLDSGRNQVMPNMRPNQGGWDSKLTNRLRMNHLNHSMGLCSRQVVDTMYRGAGIAYRFRNLAFRLSGMRQVEARSSMARFNPFYVKAGMKILPPSYAAAFKEGIEFLSGIFQSDLCDIVALKEELAAKEDWERAYIDRRLREWYYAKSAMEKSGDKMHIGMSRINGLTIEYVIRQIQQLTFGSTVYALYDNPDHGIALPSRIPLLAFDNQSTSEPLRLDLLSSV